MRMKSGLLSLLAMGAMMGPSPLSDEPLEYMARPRFEPFIPKRGKVRKSGRVSYGRCTDKQIAKRRKANKAARKSRRINRH